MVDEIVGSELTSFVFVETDKIRLLFTEVYLLNNECCSALPNSIIQGPTYRSLLGDLVMTH